MCVLYLAVEEVRVYRTTLKLMLYLMMFSNHRHAWAEQEHADSSSVSSVHIMGWCSDSDVVISCSSKMFFQ